MARHGQGLRVPKLLFWYTQYSLVHYQTRTEGQGFEALDDGCWIKHIQGLSTKGVSFHPHRSRGEDYHSRLDRTGQLSIIV